MDNNYLDQICIDFQLNDQILDEMTQMYVQNNGVQPLSDNCVQNDGNECNKSSEAMEIPQNSLQNYFQTNCDDFHSVPKFDPIVEDKIDNSCNEYLIQKYKNKINAKIDDYCMKIIRDMNTIGVCIIDHFLEDLGEFILQEVTHLYQTVSHLLKIIKFY